MVRGAQAYGAKATDNGVSIRFGDPGGGKDGLTTNALGADPNDPNKVRAEGTVVFRSTLTGTNLEGTVAHEGSHVADAQEFVNTISPGGMDFDFSKNLTEYQTKVRAYKVSNSVLAAGNERASKGMCGPSPCVLGTGLSSSQVARTIDQLLANPLNGYETAPKYGISPSNQGPRLYPSLTPPH